MTETETPDPPKNPLALNGQQRRALRAAGHHLKAIVQIGHQGLTPSVIAAVGTALARHELIKIAMLRECPEDRYEAPERLANATGAHVAQVIGRTALLYRRRHDAPVLELPGTFQESPRPQAAK